MRDRNKNRVEEKHNVNRAIKSPKVLVINKDGEQIGVLDLNKAIELAESDGLDLVEVSPNAKPPVCRILDYGKLKYRDQKKAAEARKRSTTQATKELRVRYNTDDHDLMTKVRKAEKFLKSGDKVRFTMRFRGRESVYKSLGDEIFLRIEEGLAEVGKKDGYSPLTNSVMSISFSPK